LNSWSLILVGELTANGSVDGQVVSQVDDQPVAGAMVRAPELGIMTGTDAGGFFSLELPAGTWDVEVSSIGYCTYINENVVVTNGDVTSWNCELQTASGEADTQTIDEASVTGTTTTSTFNFANTGACDLDWSALVTSSGWLSVAPGSGTVATGQSEEITVTFNASGLGAGTYQGNITISSNGYNGPEVIAVTLEIAESADDNPSLPPEQFALNGNYPNPFNATTTVRYDVANATHVTMTIYNLLGQEVRTLLDGFVEAGSHAVYWDGRNANGADLSTGIYIIQMQAEGRLFTGKSMLIR
jgi:hypothetical protein